MAKQKFNEQHKAILDTILLNFPEVKEGKMFGYPAYYVKGKLFASVMEEGVCIKIPESFGKKLFEEKKAVQFEMMGRKMREWVLLNRANSKDYIKEKAVFKKSVDYVLSLTKKSD